VRKVTVMRVSLVVLLALCSAGPGLAQVQQIEGQWNIQAQGVESEFTPVTIQRIGTATFAETAAFVIESQAIDGTVNYTGKFIYNEDRTFVYAGMGLGTGTADGQSAGIRMEVAIGGIGSTDNNMLAGVWGSKETFTVGGSDLSSERSFPVFFIRDGYDPGAPGEALAGTWQITLTSERYSWTGQVTLNPDGSMLGEYAPAAAPPIPLAGFFSYSDTKEFSFEYTTDVDVPVVGTTTITLTGNGQGDENNTKITGIWSFTVEVSGRQPQTFEGTFVLTKLVTADAGPWSGYQ